MCVYERERGLIGFSCLVTFRDLGVVVLAHAVGVGWWSFVFLRGFTSTCSAPPRSPTPGRLFSNFLMSALVYYVNEKITDVRKIFFIALMLLLIKGFLTALNPPNTWISILLLLFLQLIRIKMPVWRWMTEWTTLWWSFLSCLMNI